MVALRSSLLGWLFVGLAAPTIWAAETGPPPSDKQIAQLEQSLSGAVLVGHFTETGADAGDKLHEERYELSSVKHLGDGQWLFEARIRYGDHNIRVPLTLPMRWAGDTPVITVEKVPVIGIGTFDARVMIYANHYAGFWRGEGHGGHLFGVVQRNEKPSDEALPEK